MRKRKNRWLFRARRTEMELCNYLWSPAFIGKFRIHCNERVACLSPSQTAIPVRASGRREFNNRILSLLSSKDIMLVLGSGTLFIIAFWGG